MVFFPLDEELELLAGKLTPRGHEQLVRLSSYLPFEQAMELFEDFMGIHVSKEGCRAKVYRRGRGSV